MITHGAMKAELRRIVEALGPYREDAVFAGGFVPLIYREARLYDQTRYAPLLSGDIDITMAASLPERDRGLREYLDEHGYVVVLSRSTEPPVHYYQPTEHGQESLAPLHVEFLAPLTGPGTERDGSPRSPAEIQKGVNAQLLRYLDLLRSSPVTARLLEPQIEILVPNPAAFVVQKTLVSRLRDTTAKRDKDYAYIYDVALLTRSGWDTVGLQLRELEDEFQDKWFQKARAILDDAFGSVDGEGTRGVVTVLRDHDRSNAPTHEFVASLLTRFRDAVRL